MGVSPISLKKNRCSRHFRPMERSAGSRRRSFANLGDGGTLEPTTNLVSNTEAQVCVTDPNPEINDKKCWWERYRITPRTDPRSAYPQAHMSRCSSAVRCSSLPALLVGVFLLAVRLQGRVHPLSEQLHLAGVGQTLGICR